jgi:hypothetical protein
MPATRWQRLGWIRSRAGSGTSCNHKLQWQLRAGCICSQSTAATLLKVGWVDRPYDAKVHPSQTTNARIYSTKEAIFGAGLPASARGQRRLSRTLSMINTAARAAAPLLTIGRLSTSHPGAAISASANCRDSQPFGNFDRVQTRPRWEAGNPN